MDQPRISNCTGIKDNENIHPPISHQSYVSTCTFHKKQMKAGGRAVNLKVHLFWEGFPKWRNM